MSNNRNGKLDLRSQVYLFLLTPADLYCRFVSWVMGIGWSGPEKDYE